MPIRESKSGSELFIVDNSDAGRKAHKYLYCWRQLSKKVDIRKKLDKHLNKTYLRKVQAPVGVKPILRAWMELN